MKQLRLTSEEARAVAPLARTNKDGLALRRPDPIEAEIALALGFDEDELLRRAAVRDGEDDGYMSSECMVHLIRHHLHRAPPEEGSRHLAERLVEHLLRRTAAELRGSVRGFAGSTLDEVREEILGRLALLLADPGDAADFYEVRFALAMKRLRIDVCRQARRRTKRLVAIEDLRTPETGPMDALEARADREALGRPLGPEELAGLKEALLTLEEEERKAFLLHRLAGVSVNARRAGAASLVEILGLSERTVRSRLRRAEAKLRALMEEKR